MTDLPASAIHDIHPLIAGRWSTRAYSEYPVSHRQVLTLLEAARWSPSAFNTQPWRFVVFEKTENPETFARAFATLIPFNRSWNASAQVLITILADTLTTNEAFNPSASYDTGAASMALLLQAHAQGLAAHPMSGFDADAFRQAFNIPDRMAILSMISVAHFGEVEKLPAALAEREAAPRTRLSIDEIARFGTWERP